MAEVAKKVDATKAFLLILVVVLLFMARPSAQPGPGPGPDPKPVAVDMQKASRKAMQFTAQHFSEASTILADEIRDGKIKTADQLLKRSQVLFPAALEQAMNQDDVGGGVTFNGLDTKLLPAEWKDDAERARVEQLFRDKARGFGSVK